MKNIHKLTMFALLLISGFQLSAKNKERIFVINEYGKEIVARVLTDFISVEKNIKKDNSECLALSGMKKVYIFEKGVTMTGIYSVADAVKPGNVIVVTKKSRYTPKIKIYKNYAAFIAAKPDYELNGKICPSVLPAA